MVAGVVMLLGRHIPVRLPGVRVTAAPGKSLWRLVGFGAGYALASASCTLAILLAVVTQAVTAETVAGVITVFAANATGSALVLLALAVAAALTHTALSAALGGIARYLPRISGALLAASGGYLIAYWLPHLDGSTPTQTLRARPRLGLRHRLDRRQPNHRCRYHTERHRRRCSHLRDHRAPASLRRASNRLLHRRRGRRCPACPASTNQRPGPRCQPHGRLSAPPRITSRA